METDQERHEVAVEAGRRMIGHGDRPLYRVRVDPVGRQWRFRVVELPLVRGESTDFSDVRFRARELIAQELDADRDQFDVALLGV